MHHWLKPLTAAALGLTLFAGLAHAGDPQSQRVDNRQDRQSHRIGQGVHAQTTSPRNRNLASATDPTKPNSTISIAPSKYISLS